MWPCGGRRVTQGESWMCCFWAAAAVERRCFGGFSGVQAAKT